MAERIKFCFFCDGSSQMQSAWHYVKSLEISTMWAMYIWSLGVGLCCQPGRHLAVAIVRLTLISESSCFWDNVCPHPCHHECFVCTRVEQEQGWWGGWITDIQIILFIWVLTPTSAMGAFWCIFIWNINILYSVTSHRNLCSYLLMSHCRFIPLAISPFKHKEQSAYPLKFCWLVDFLSLFSFK